MRKLMFSALLFGTVALFSCKKKPHSLVESNVFTVSNWSGGGDGFSAMVIVDFVTKEVHDNGVVMCYLKDNADWVALPLTMSNGTNSWTSHYLFSTFIGGVEFVFYDDDGITLNPGTRTFKIVAISAAGMAQNPNVNLHDYEQVRQTFDLD